MLQRLTEYTLISALFCASLILIMWVKWFCVQNGLLGIENESLGLDGVLACFCLMFGFKKVHIALVSKIFRNSSIFDANRNDNCGK
ncbi:hypothetical protein A1QO_02590 [Vibrio genomosp. F10 str. ZF-129]|uniref:Uncharacterized protein n=1 Tax=Vibrio genomosp. F10 str. ZF-129 TaxID=1187848 RepID=A0A1E5BKK2_9VIBR|nr:hypothetical protein A1QO_02590 [Vibrio genomosp. F10 str. ZF-129]